MDTYELFQRLSVALAIGLLIGLERGWKERGEREGNRTAGVRTFALLGLLGGLWGSIAHLKGEGGAIALGIAFAVVTLVLATFRYRETAHENSFGVTTVVAAMLCFALGAFAVLGDMQAAAASGVAVTALLSLKAVLHSFVERLTWLEFRSGLMLLAMTFIMLPLLPNRTVDPWQTLNPFEIWFLTVMIATISFAGYVAIKAFGSRRGVVFGGIAGGLASSTATTINMAQLAAKHPDQLSTLLAGALLAGATMMARMLAIVTVANPKLLPLLAAPFGFAAVAQSAIAVHLLKWHSPAAGTSQDLRIENPFDLAVVLKFGALLTVVTIIAKFATSYAGGYGAYAVSAVSGIADVDAITLSMARLGDGQISTAVAAGAIALAGAVNTVAKAVMGWGAGGYEFGWRMLAAAAVAIAAGFAGYLLGPVA